jgi:hypothetical protein
MPCGGRSLARDSDEKWCEICGARGSGWWGQVAPNVHLKPWECGDRILGTAKLGIEEACAGDSVQVCGDHVEHRLGGENPCRPVER